MPVMYLREVLKSILKKKKKANKNITKQKKTHTEMNEHSVLQSDGGLQNHRSKRLVFIHEPSSWQEKKAGFIALSHLFT